MDATLIRNAIKNINSDAGFRLHNDELDTIVWLNNTNPIPVNDMQTEIDRLQAEYDSQEYARSRKTDYPDIGDQLDALYHAGVFPANMAARIKETKDKYPK